MAAVRYVTCDRWVRNEFAGTKNPALPDLSLPEEVIVVLDRCIEGSLGQANTLRVMAVSNVTYETELEAIRLGTWDLFWVMSEFLRQEVSWLRPDVPCHIIPPCFESASRPHSQRDRPRGHRLIYPHRPDPLKGLNESIGLLRRLLRQTSDPWELAVIEPSQYERSDTRQYFRKTLTMNKDLVQSGRIQTIPWKSTGDMGEVYASFDCALMGTRLREGFGYVPYESVLAGTPCVVTLRGDLAVAPRMPGILATDLLDSDQTSKIVQRAVRMEIGPEQQSLILERYSPDAQARAIRQSMDFLGGAGSQVSSDSEQ